MLPKRRSIRRIRNPAMSKWTIAQGRNGPGPLIGEQKKSIFKYILNFSFTTPKAREKSTYTETDIHRYPMMGFSLYFDSQEKTPVPCG